jgi:tetratricopeptide (TPR) repeat protein
MNMKLALTFDPGNALYAEAFDELSRNPGAQARTADATRDRARELYDQATAAESRGDVDGAIAILERAIEELRQPAFHNRLGVILAMKKREYARAQALVEQAIELSGGNATYERNLAKIVSLAAAAEVKPKDTGRRGGLLGLLGLKR